MPASGTRIAFDPDGLNTGVTPVPTADQLVTPLESFYTRSHARVPAVDPAAWRLQVEGMVDRPLSLTLAALAREFHTQSVTATLVCAGLRRAEFESFRPIAQELPWGAEAIGTGRWSGVPLCEVLARAGVAQGARYVEFVGLDSVERHGRRFGFGGSIDLDKATSPDVLLATHLNDQPLTPEHGFPVRVVVPGWIGARSVKWLGRAIVQASPSENYFQTKAYRVERSVNPRDPRDVSGGVAIAEVPINSMILDPRPGQAVAAGPLTVRGWAIGEGAKRLAAIELSTDGGEHWMAASPVVDGEAWAWTMWEATVPLQPGRHQLVVRARDVGGRSQPLELAATWNVKGYCNNAWHRVVVIAK